MTQTPTEPAQYATAAHVSQAWRPLTPTESERAEYLIGMAVRQLRRRWPDLDARAASGALDLDDVRDVIVWMVIPVLGGPPMPGAKSWRVAAGSESQQVDMGSGNANPDRLMVIAAWMVEIFEGDEQQQSAALPKFHAPPAGRYERVFPEWPEETAHRGWPG
ncbi:MAG: Gp19/Gp15/Gp42 family protein [Micrococcus sp.]|nr:Gp19/Gp15/Gp42 family protein [Micrococcus sp.]